MENESSSLIEKRVEKIMIGIGHSSSNLGSLVLPQLASTASPDTDSPTTPTIEPTTPDVQPGPDVDPTPEDEPVEPPKFVPREDPDVDPSPTCPEGEPDEGDGEFETCRLPGIVRF
jgi:hypothetical protein